MTLPGVRTLSPTFFVTACARFVSLLSSLHPRFLVVVSSICQAKLADLIVVVASANVMLWDLASANIWFSLDVRILFSDLLDGVHLGAGGFCRNVPWSLFSLFVWGVLCSLFYYNIYHLPVFVFLGVFVSCSSFPLILLFLRFFFFFLLLFFIFVVFFFLLVFLLLLLFRVFFFFLFFYVSLFFCLLFWYDPPRAGGGTKVSLGACELFASASA